MFPIVMGLESPRPGRATFQAFFNWVGILFSMENPFPSGPLKQGQSSARIAKGRRRRLVMRSLRVFMLIKITDQSWVASTSFRATRWCLGLRSRETIPREDGGPCGVTDAELKLPLVCPGFLLLVLAELYKQLVFDLLQFYGQGILVYAHAPVAQRPGFH